jgi:hypothetical protein
MIKFFRRIRQNLLTENKPVSSEHSTGSSGQARPTLSSGQARPTLSSGQARRLSKYLLYAIGEILLVVIGIMIALYVNNKNQERGEEREIRAALIEIQRDLAQDIKFTNLTYDRYLLKDSIKNLVMNNSVRYDDIKTKRLPVATLAYQYTPMWRQKNGYEQFLQMVKGMPEKYKELLPELNELHNIRGYQVDAYHKKYLETLVKVQDESYSQLDWYGQDQFTGEMSDEQIDFYLHSPLFKSYVMRMSHEAENMVSAVGWYRAMAMRIYYKIDELLDGQGFETPDYMRSTSLGDSTKAEPLVGHYEQISGPVISFIGTTVEITSQGKQLYLNLEGGLKILLQYCRPKKLDFFIESSSVILKFNPIENGEFIMIGDNLDERRWRKVVKSNE